MDERPRADPIGHKPIGAGLDAFRDDLASVCESSGLPCSVESISRLNAEACQNLALDLVLALQALPASRSLPPISGRKNLFSDLFRLNASINSDDFDFLQIAPLVGAILSREPDGVIWDKVYAAAAESTPPSKPPPQFEQTPYSHSTSAISNSNEHRDDIDAVLKEELGSIYTDVPGFDEAYFDAVDGLREVAAAVFDTLKGSGDFSDDDTIGWRGWPDPAEETRVLDWLIATVDRIKKIATEKNFLPEDCRSILGFPRQPLQGSTAARKL